MRTAIYPIVIAIAAAVLAGCDSSYVPADKNRGSATGDISGADAALKRTRAEADYKMALQKCTEKSGPARESCEAEAKATLDATLAP